MPPAGPLRTRRLSLVPSVRVTHGHGINIGKRHMGTLKGLSNHGHNAFQVRSRGDLGHHALKALMQFVLRGNDTSQNYKLVVAEADSEDQGGN